MGDRPLPRILEFDRPFWEACNRDTLLLQRCQSPGCGRWIYYPRVCCPYCGGGDLAWSRASGRGAIRSYTILHRAQNESFAAELPYHFIAVDLAEGPMFFSRLIDPPCGDAGLLRRPVIATFVQHTPQQRLPYFRLA